METHMRKMRSDTVRSEGKKKLERITPAERGDGTPQNVQKSPNSFFSYQGRISQTQRERDNSIAMILLSFNPTLGFNKKMVESVVKDISAQGGGNI